MGGEWVGSGWGVGGGGGVGGEWVGSGFGVGGVCVNLPCDYLQLCNNICNLKSSLQTLIYEMNILVLSV